MPRLIMSLRMLLLTSTLIINTTRLDDLPVPFPVPVPVPFPVPVPVPVPVPGFVPVLLRLAGKARAGIRARARARARARKGGSLIFPIFPFKQQRNSVHFGNDMSKTQPRHEMISDPNKIFHECAQFIKTGKIIPAKIRIAESENVMICIDF